MRHTLPLLALLAASASWCSCSGTGGSESDVADIHEDSTLTPNPQAVDFSVPGNLVVDGKPLPLGTPIGWVVNAMGEPASTRDLGAAGRLMLYPKWSLEVLVSPPDTGLEQPADDPGGGAALEPPPPVEEVVAFHLLPGFAGKAQDGLALGITEAALADALGKPQQDPFGQGLWFPEAGVFAALVDGKVTLLTLTEPAR